MRGGGDDDADNVNAASFFLGLGRRGVFLTLRVLSIQGTVLHERHLETDAMDPARWRLRMAPLWT